MKTKLQLIALDRLIDTPPQYSRRGKIETARLLLRSVFWRYERWQLYVAFTLIQFLAGLILLVCSINLYGISGSLLFPGIAYPVCMLHPGIRAHPTVCLLEIYGTWGVLTLVFAIISIYS